MAKVFFKRYGLTLLGFIRGVGWFLVLAVRGMRERDLSDHVLTAI